MSDGPTGFIGILRWSPVCKVITQDPGGGVAKVPMLLDMLNSSLSPFVPDLNLAADPVLTFEPSFRSFVINPYLDIGFIRAHLDGHALDILLLPVTPNNFYIFGPGYIAALPSIPFELLHVQQADVIIIGDIQTGNVVSLELQMLPGNHIGITAKIGKEPVPVTAAVGFKGPAAGSSPRAWG